MIEVEAPRIKFRVGRDDVARTLSEILSTHNVADIVVEDPPLEEVIAAAFNQAADSMANEAKVSVEAS